VPGGHDGSVASAAPGPRNWRGAIVSPIDGDIDAVNVSPGEIADVGGAIVTVADLSNITVEANVPEGELGNLQEGDAITLHVDALPGRAFTGTIVHVADELDPHTGTDTVLCAVPNPDGALRVNMFGKVEIAEPLGRKAVQVADTAIQNVNGHPAIFVQVGKGKFAWRIVRTGSNSNGFTEIEQGLSPGTPVVTDGSYWLKAALLRSAIPDEG
jgi:cobalt-zinc-cadmium efflux system membrane fusion protein